MSEQQFDGLTLAFIGGGTMGGAIVHALISTGQVSPDQVVVSEPYAPRRDELHERYAVAVVDDNVAAASEADIVVLAVKPQVLPAVMRQLQGCIRPNALVFSIVAGMPIVTMRNGLHHDAIVRTMPNTPAQIGEGMTVWTAAPQVTEAQLGQARAILQTMGLEMYVDHEDALDMATAVSGTGPTYVFMLMEALVDAAVHLGFARHQARTLVIQTVLGSVKYAQQSNLHLAEMRNMVTSPGGTSAEAIYQMEKGGVRTVFSKAVWAAYKKSRLLGERAQQPAEGPLPVGEDGSKD
ncbi:MAG: pyrroline-5-carboxylate reductase [Chloroflexi bacterium]|nr:pyrroline-5-carboxylate reductase [Chloroflexota bacterium]